MKKKACGHIGEVTHCLECRPLNLSVRGGRYRSEFGAFAYVTEDGDTFAIAENPEAAERIAAAMNAATKPAAEERPRSSDPVIQQAEILAGADPLEVYGDPDAANAAYRDLIEERDKLRAELVQLRGDATKAKYSGTVNELLDRLVNTAAKLAKTHPPGAAPWDRVSVGAGGFQYQCDTCRLIWTGFDSPNDASRFALGHNRTPDHAVRVPKVAR